MNQLVKALKACTEAIEHWNESGSDTEPRWPLKDALKLACEVLEESDQSCHHFYQQVLADGTYWCMDCQKKVAH